MTHKNIIALLGQAIREGKYINITYKNQNEVINPFWIAILNINANDRIIEINGSKIVSYSKSIC